MADIVPLCYMGMISGSTSMWMKFFNSKSSWLIHARQYFSQILVHLVTRHCTKPKVPEIVTLLLGGQLCISVCDAVCLIIAPVVLFCLWSGDFNHTSNHSITCTSHHLWLPVWQSNPFMRDTDIKMCTWYRAYNRHVRDKNWCSEHASYKGV